MSAPSASTVGLRGPAAARAARFRARAPLLRRSYVSVVDRAPDNLYLLVVARRHDNDMPAEAAMGPEAIANASRAIPALSDMW